MLFNKKIPNMLAKSTYFILKLAMLTLKLSPPSRGRGLKQEYERIVGQNYRVAPFTGAVEKKPPVYGPSWVPLYAANRSAASR